MNPVTEWLQTATVFDWITNVTAFISLALLLLVVHGFRRYTIRPRTEPIDYIGTGIWLMALTKAIRMVWWDIVPDLMGRAYWKSLDFQASDANWIFNIAVLLGAWFMLKGFHMLVEERAPGVYNLFTCVFYPSQIRLSFIRSKREDHK